MTTDNFRAEHFCTLFDSKFLPIAMTLHSSLMLHARPFHLWVVCMDEAVEEQLTLLNLSSVTLIPLREIETPELLAVKPGRDRREYCWTMTPFTFTAVFDRYPDLERVTYLDADLFFFDDPRTLLEEFEECGRSILITEHAFDPRYDQSLQSGKFCVQFITSRNNDQGLKVILWWQKKCLQWCFARVEKGKFGDQKYLDTWPLLFPNDIWILQQKERTLAPWNVQYFEEVFGDIIDPAFYHFHGLKILEPDQVLLAIDYTIGERALEKIYTVYLESLRKNLDIVKENNLEIPCIPYLQDWTSERILDYCSRQKLYLYRFNCDNLITKEKPESRKMLVETISEFVFSHLSRMVRNQSK